MQASKQKHKPVTNKQEYLGSSLLSNKMKKRVRILLIMLGIFFFFGLPMCG